MIKACQASGRLTRQPQSQPGTDFQDKMNETASRKDTAAAPTIDRLSVYSSDVLFKGARELVIEHNGEFYRLKVTRQGKLILNK